MAGAAGSRPSSMAPHRRQKKMDKWQETVIQIAPQE